MTNRDKQKISFALGIFVATGLIGTALLVGGHPGEWALDVTYFILKIRAGDFWA